MFYIIGIVIVLFILYIISFETKPFLSPISDDEIAVYWSGGYNSTFRLLELLHSGISVVPIHRVEKEIDQYKLLNLWYMIADKYPHISNIQFINRISINNEVKNAYSLGDIPYDLISLSLHYDKNIEICCDIDHKLSQLVKPYINSVEYDSGEGDYNWKDKDQLRKRALLYRKQKIITKTIVDDRIKIMHKLIFPLIFRTRENINNKSSRDGYYDLLKFTI